MREARKRPPDIREDVRKIRINDLVDDTVDVFIRQNFLDSNEADALKCAVDAGRPYYLPVKGKAPLVIRPA